MRVAGSKSSVIWQITGSFRLNRLSGGAGGSLFVCIGENFSKNGGKVFPWRKSFELHGHSPTAFIERG
jgi:hypothetical protein